MLGTFTWIAMGVMFLSQCLLLAALIRANLRRSPGKKDLLALVMQQNERLLDRLMSKNLAEYAARSAQSEGPDIVSHPRNDEIEAAIEAQKNAREIEHMRRTLGV